MANPLAELRRKKNDFARRQEERDLPKAEWLSIEKGGRVRVQFLQDLSDESPNYNGSWGKSPAVLPGMDPDDPNDRYDIGLFLMAKEHVAPGAKGKGRALDTMDSEGRDFAEEMLKRTGEKDWRAKENFYITVAVDNGTDTPDVRILTRGVYSEFVDELMEYFEEHGTIMGQVFEIKKGREQTSPWQIKEGKGEPLNVDGLVPYDLARQAVKHIKYEDQEKWYMKNYVPTDGAPVEDRRSSRQSDSEDPWAKSASSKSNNSGGSDPWGSDDESPDW